MAHQKMLAGFLVGWLTVIMVQMTSSAASKTSNHWYFLMLNPKTNYTISDKLKAYFEFQYFRNENMWSNHTIPYIFNPDQGVYSDDEKAIIKQGMDMWQSKTCIQFKEIKNKSPAEVKYVSISKSLHTPTGWGKPIGCWTLVGPKHAEERSIPMSLVSGSCITRSSVAHELGHVLGLPHHQGRYNADKHVILHLENAYPFFRFNFRFYSKYPDLTILGLPYDIGSVMHLPGHMFSITGRPTLQPRDPLYTQAMGSGYGSGGPSFYDAKFINMAYCTANCRDSVGPLNMNRHNHCKNGGYVDVRDANHCDRCICPDGFSGQYCQNVSEGSGAVCGGLLTAANGSLSSPWYNESGYTSGQQCSWLIKAPKGKRVKFQFLDQFEINCFNYSFFDMYRGVGPGTFSRVCQDWVEVRIKKDLANTGPRFCCEQRPNVTLISETEQMLVLFRANADLDDRMTGFKAYYELTPLKTET